MAEETISTTSEKIGNALADDAKATKEDAESMVENVKEKVMHHGKDKEKTNE